MRTLPDPESVALTGATGFIGQHLLRRLVSQGLRVRCLIRAGSETRLPSNRHVIPIPGSLEDRNCLTGLVRGCGTVIHLAGTIGGRSYRELAAVNVSGTGNLLEAVRGTTPEAHLIHMSSLAAREPDLSWYTRSKRAGEDLITADPGPWTVLRPPAVYGPGDPALAPLWRTLARGWLLQIGPGAQRFSMAHVNDITDAIVRLMSLDEAPRGIIPIQDGRPGGYQWPDIAAEAAAGLGRDVRRVRLPAGLLWPVAMLNLKIPVRTRPVLTPGKLRELAHPDWVCDNEALKECLGWQPSLDFSRRLGTLPGWEP